MHNIQEISINNIIVHYIGSKIEEEGVQLSSQPIVHLTESTEDLLKHYFLNPFKEGEYFHISSNSVEVQNLVLKSISRMFEESESFYEESVNLARLLYQHSEHPKIKPGELYIASFFNCVIDGELMDAIGLFKSESKEPFFKVIPDSNHNFDIIPDVGINTNKLDKGCLIYKTEAEKGYLVSLVDTSAKGAEAQYWRNGFLQLIPRKDDYFLTRSYLDMCKSFVVEQAPKEFEVSKADQADFLNKSATYFKNNQDFDLNGFTQEVISEPQVAESFKEYKKQYEADKELHLEDEFEISLPAVKKQSKVLKSVIKLDKNFHIYVHGNRENIVRGYDEHTGLNYYQIYFKEEE